MWQQVPRFNSRRSNMQGRASGIKDWGWPQVIWRRVEDCGGQKDDVGGKWSVKGWWRGGHVTVAEQEAGEEYRRDRS